MVQSNRVTEERLMKGQFTKMWPRLRKKQIRARTSESGLSSLGGKSKREELLSEPGEGHLREAVLSGTKAPIPFM